FGGEQTLHHLCAMRIDYADSAQCVDLAMSRGRETPAVTIEGRTGALGKLGMQGFRVSGRVSTPREPHDPGVDEGLRNAFVLEPALEPYSVLARMRCAVGHQRDCRDTLRFIGLIEDLHRDLTRCVAAEADVTALGVVRGTHPQAIIVVGG